MDQKIYRTRPRLNEEVNGHWMCDEGRFCYHEWQDLDRLEFPLIQQDGELRQTTWPEAIESAINNFKSILDTNGDSAIGVVGSSIATNEENYLLHKLATDAFKTNWVGLSRKPDGETWTAKNGFRIEADKSPNSRGASDMLGVDSINDIIKGINKGSIRGLYMLGGDINQTFSSEVVEALGKLEFLVVHDLQRSDLAELADVVFPSASPFEKSGTMTNVQGRVQRVNPAFPQPGTARDDGTILRYVGQRMGVDMGGMESAKILEEIAKNVEGYSGLTSSLLGDQGVMTDGEEPSDAVGG